MLKHHLAYNCLLENNFLCDVRSATLIYLTDPGLSKLYEKTRGQWYFTMGDSDII